MAGVRGRGIGRDDSEGMGALTTSIMGPRELFGSTWRALATAARALRCGLMHSWAERLRDRALTAAEIIQVLACKGAIQPAVWHGAQGIGGRGAWGGQGCRRPAATPLETCE